MRGTGVVATVAPAGKSVPRSEFMNTSLNGVSPEYFETMGMRFLSGRNFRPDEPKTKSAPAVVNRAFVRHFFGGSDAVGEKFGLGAVVDKAASDAYQIIGVVSDAKYRSLREVIPPTLYRWRAPQPPHGTAYEATLSATTVLAEASCRPGLCRSLSRPGSQKMRNAALE
jgi:putative ABC transport system permease protein